MSGVVVLVSYRSLPEHVDIAKREIGRLVASVQAIEPDCGGITLLQDASDLLPLRRSSLRGGP